MYICMYVCMYVCVYVYYVCICSWLWPDGCPPRAVANLADLSDYGSLGIALSHGVRREGASRAYYKSDALRPSRCVCIDTYRQETYDLQRTSQSHFCRTHSAGSQLRSTTHKGSNQGSILGHVLPLWLYTYIWLWIKTLSRPPPTSLTILCRGRPFQTLCR